MVDLLLGAAAVVALGVISLGAHWWTKWHHRQTHRPNWTLFEYVNWLCVALFVASIMQLYKTSDMATPDPKWGLVCVVALVYFFSFFGVSMVHSVLEEAQHSHGPARTAEPPRPRARPQSYHVLALEPIELLRLAKDRLSRPSPATDVESQGDILANLMSLAGSGCITVDMLRETNILCTVGTHCKRTCGCCQTCSWCKLRYNWRQLALREMKARRKAAKHREAQTRRIPSVPSLPSIPEDDVADQAGAEEPEEPRPWPSLPRR